MSSAVSGAPDDHFIPRRSSMVTVLPSALCSKARATFDQLYSKYSRLPGPAAKRCAVAPPAAPPDERLAERPAVLADPVDRLEHERVLADAFGDRRQLALLYERGELRRLFERLRPPRSASRIAAVAGTRRGTMSRPRRRNTSEPRGVRGSACPAAHPHSCLRHHRPNGRWLAAWYVFPDDRTGPIPARSDGQMRAISAARGRVRTCGRSASGAFACAILRARGRPVADSMSGPGFAT